MFNSLTHLCIIVLTPKNLSVFQFILAIFHLWHGSGGLETYLTNGFIFIRDKELPSVSSVIKILRLLHCGGQLILDRRIPLESTILSLPARSVDRRPEAIVSGFKVRIKQCYAEDIEAPRAAH